MIITLLITSTLLGCGGDNHSESSTLNETPSVNAPIEDTQPEDITNEQDKWVNVEAIKQTGSGTQQDAQAIFVLHDNAGHIISQHQANQYGQAQLPWSKQAAHLTYVTRNDEQVLKLQSFMNITANDIQGKRFTYQAKNCPSSTLILDLDNLTNDAIDQILVVNAKTDHSIMLSPINGDTTLKVEYCDHQSQLPVQLINTHNGTAKAGLITHKGLSEYSLSLLDFPEMGQYTDLSGMHNWEYVMLKGEHHQNVRENSSSAPYFDYYYPTLNPHTQVTFIQPFEESFTDTNEDFRLTVIASSHRNLNAQAQFDHSPYQLSLSPLHKMQSESLFKNILKYHNKLYLDLMTFTSDYQQIDIELCDEHGNEHHYESCNDNKLNWRIHSFLSTNNQPWQQLEFPSNIQDTLNQINHFAVSLKLKQHLAEMDKIEKLSELTEAIDSQKKHPKHEVDSLHFGIIMKKQG